MMNLVKRLINTVFIAFLSFLFTNELYAQCSPASEAATACSGTVAADGGSYTTGTYYHSAGATTFASLTLGSSAILRVCGTLTITALTVNVGTSAGSPVKIIVESGGTLTVTLTNGGSGMGSNNYLTVENKGTLNLNGTWCAVATTNDVYIITSNSSATTTFGGPISFSDGTIVNRGTNVFNSSVQVSGTTTMCFERSMTNFNSSFQNTLNSLTMSAGNENVVLNYNSTFQTAAFAWSSKIKTCKGASGAADFTATTGGTYSTPYCTFPPLPVVLTSFTAKSNANSVDLAWVTAQEFNNDHFELERSHDGMNFEKIKDIKGQGTKNSPSTYIYNDNEVNTLLPIYYRLKQVDEDGKFEYSNVIVLNGSEGNSSIEIYPNPLDEGTTLYARFGDNDEGIAKVSLFDLSGKLINEYLLDDIQPNGIYAVEDKNLLLVEGSYILQIKTLQNVYNQKLQVK